MVKTYAPLDVWLRFDDPEDELATYEANTFTTEDGTFVVEWYHNDVGLVTKEYFFEYSDAVMWYEENGFYDFTS